MDSYKLSTITDEFLETQMKPFDKIVLWQGDITTIATAAIVNAANSKMLAVLFHYTNVSIMPYTQLLVLN